jgi:selenocysteine lyase/cysteine desulfurase
VSNVTGVIHPLDKIRAAVGAIPLAVDGAQSVGALPIDVQEMGVDFFVFTGHKSLMGPQGTGGVYIRDGFRVEPLMRGGTGSRSDSEEHPDFLPDRYECGTHNTVGLAGLRGGIRFVRKQGLKKIRRHEMALTTRLLRGLSHIDGVVLYGPKDPETRSAIVSFNILGLTPSEVTHALDRGYGILARGGLHCAPAAHRTMGTFPKGTVRLSLGFFNTRAEVGEILRALGHIARSSRRASRTVDRIQEVR